MYSSLGVTFIMHAFCTTGTCFCKKYIQYTLYYTKVLKFKFWLQLSSRIVTLFYNNSSTKWCITWLPLLNLMSVIEHNTYVFFQTCFVYCVFYAPCEVNQNYFFWVCGTVWMRLPCMAKLAWDLHVHTVSKFLFG